MTAPRKTLSYCHNSYIETRMGENTPIAQVVGGPLNGIIILRMDGYALIPIEEFQRVLDGDTSHYADFDAGKVMPVYGDAEKLMASHPIFKDMGKDGDDDQH